MCTAYENMHTGEIYLNHRKAVDAWLESGDPFRVFKAEKPSNFLIWEPVDFTKEETMKLTIKPPKLYKVKFINYFDVWGNSHDGYWVNNLCEEWTVETTSVENRDLFDLLIEKQFLVPNARFGNYVFEDFWPFIEVYSTSGMYPLGRFEIEEV